MDVTVTALRAELASWLDRVKAGEQIVVTERGTPVARLTPLETTTLVERLTRDGVLGPAQRPGPRPRASAGRRVRARGSVSDLVSEQRD